MYFFNLCDNCQTIKHIFMLMTCSPCFHRFFFLKSYTFSKVFVQCLDLLVINVFVKDANNNPVINHLYVGWHFIVKFTY